MESEVVKTEMVLAATFPFKKVQIADKYPKGQSRGRQWKHLRLLLQAADATSLPPDRPNYLNIQSPPSIYPPKRYCDITGFEAPYVDPRTKLRYADPEVFKQIRMLPDEYVQRREMGICALESVGKYISRSSVNQIVRDDFSSVVIADIMAGDVQFVLYRRS
uniref:Vps72/YL1 C-terminal domain-containing protein n=2 Tax=Oryza TaxID=4527 RepID=A0A0E0P6N3_ORYRU